MRLILLTLLLGSIKACNLRPLPKFNIDRQNIGPLPRICTKEPGAPICEFFKLPLEEARILCLGLQSLAKMAGTADPKGMLEFALKTWGTPNCINLAEFTKMWIDLGLDPAAQAQEAFNAIDHDGSSCIDVNEWVRVITMLRGFCSQMSSVSFSNGPKQWSSLVKLLLSIGFLILEYVCNAAVG